MFSKQTDSTGWPGGSTVRVSTAIPPHSWSHHTQLPHPPTHPPSVRRDRGHSPLLTRGWLAGWQAGWLTVEGVLVPSATSRYCGDLPTTRRTYTVLCCTHTLLSVSPYFPLLPLVLYIYVYICIVTFP